MVSQLETRAFTANRTPAMTVEGLVQVFTCTHRSFFTSVMAQALRIAGQGAPVLVVQFLKGGIGQGSDRPVQLSQSLDWVRCDLPGCINQADLDEISLQAIRHLWRYTQDVVAQSRYDLVVLDELSLAINFGAIDQTEVLEFLRDRPRKVDVILTGPDMPSAILDVADQITELRRSHQP